MESVSIQVKSCTFTSESNLAESSSRLCSRSGIQRNLARPNRFGSGRLGWVIASNANSFVLHRMLVQRRISHDSLRRKLCNKFRFRIFGTVLVRKISRVRFCDVVQPFGSFVAPLGLFEPVFEKDFGFEPSGRGIVDGGISVCCARTVYFRVSARLPDLKNSKSRAPLSCLPPLGSRRVRSRRTSALLVASLCVASTYGVLTL